MRRELSASWAWASTWARMSRTSASNRDDAAACLALTSSTRVTTCLCSSLLGQSYGGETHPRLLVDQSHHLVALDARRLTLRTHLIGHAADLVAVCLDLTLPNCTEGAYAVTESFCLCLCLDAGHKLLFDPFARLGLDLFGALLKLLPLNGVLLDGSLRSASTRKDICIRRQPTIAAPHLVVAGLTRDHAFLAVDDIVERIGLCSHAIPGLTQVLGPASELCLLSAGSVMWFSQSQGCGLETYGAYLVVAGPDLGFRPVEVCLCLF